MIFLRYLALLSIVYCGFIHREGTSFKQDGKKFYYGGCNAYNLFTKTHLEIDQRLTEMKSDGVRVLRTWGFNHQEWHGFEPKKGVYIEEQFKLFDYIMKAARDRGIYVIITLENYWDDYGGIDSRLSWEGLPGKTNKNRAVFYTNQGCKNSYKNYVKHFLDRKNTFTNINYKDDPTIFAWELMNEPRYQDAGENESGITFRKWVDEMSAFMKSIDKNHMVATGVEGHGRKYGYGGDEGNPFVYVHQSPNIDFTTAHMYPDEDWAKLDPTKAAQVVGMWIHDSHSQVKKPFILEEYNSKTRQTEYWRAMLKTLESLDGSGDNFWNYMSKAESHGPFDIYHGHPILDAVYHEHAKIMNNKH